MVYGKRTRSKRSGGTRAMVKAEVTKALSKTTEVKHNNLGWTAEAFSDRPYAINPVDYISQGDSAQTRSGNRINMLSMNLRVNSTLPAGQQTSTQRVRVCLVETREPLSVVTVGQTPQYDARPIFDAFSSSLGANNFFDTDTVKKIHFNKMMTYNQLVADQQIIKYCNIYAKFGKLGKRIFYDGDSQGGNQLGLNTKTYIYFVIVSDKQSNDANPPSVLVNWKCRFTDA